MPRSARLTARLVALPRVLTIAVALLAPSACMGPPPAPPTAVIDTSPDSVCAGDGFSTEIRLSGARSSPRLSLVPGAPDPSAAPLSYRWDLSGTAYRIVRGSLDAADVAVVVEGDRPLHASLTVSDVEGGEATSLRSVGVTFALVPCDLEGDPACAEDTECAPFEDGRACLPLGECAADDECPACFVCDPGSMRCVPGGWP